MVTACSCVLSWSESSFGLTVSPAGSTCESSQLGFARWRQHVVFLAADFSRAPLSISCPLSRSLALQSIYSSSFVGLSIH